MTLTFADRIAEIEAEVDAASYPQAVEEWNLYYGRDRGDDAFAQGCYVNTIPELIEWWQHAYLYLWRHETVVDVRRPERRHSQQPRRP